MGKVGGGGGGGVIRAPQRRGGVWNRGTRDRPVPRGWSKTSDDASPTAPLSGPDNFFFKKKFPHDTYLKMISASWGSF